MFDKDTLTALQEGHAIIQSNTALAASKDTKEIVALPKHYDLHDLEAYLPNRRRARGTMTTDALDSFVSFTKAHQEPGATVFVDPCGGAATAVLNLGTPTAPGHADNKAKLALSKTAAFQALLAHANGNGLAQKVVAEFIEDWADNIQCFDSAGQIKTSLAVAAVRKITIDAMRKIESTEQSLSASKSAFESVTATSTEPLPTLILFVCQPYKNLLPRTFALRLGVLTGESTPKVNLRISKLEEHNEQMAQELADLIIGKFDSDIKVVMGSYAKS